MDNLLFLIYGDDFYELIAVECKIILQILDGIVPLLKGLDFGENEHLKEPLFWSLI